MALAPAAVEAGMPLLGICRGFQEVVVAFGGSLHPQLQNVPGLERHRLENEDALDKKYGPLHEVEVMAGGMLEKITGESGVTVNSVHEQGADRLGAGLRVEAVAPDGLVEAVSMENARRFALAVQWHPEWDFSANPVSGALFRAFGSACRAYRMRSWTRGA